MVEGEGEEAKDFPALFLRASHRKQVARGIGCVDRVRDVVQVVASVAGFYPLR